MMRHAAMMLILAGLFAATACGADDARLVARTGDHVDEAYDESDEHSDEYSGEHVHDSAHGEVHDFTFGVGSDSANDDFEAGAEMRTHTITPDAPFRGLKAMVTAAKLDLEIRLVFAHGRMGSWMPLSPDQSVDRFHNGHLALYDYATELQFRSTSPVDYVRFEFFDAPVDSADSHDDIGTAEDVRRQALAHPGRYQPPADVQEAGRAQAGNFAYESAPAYNGGRNCSGTFQPGARELGNFLVDNFEGAAYFQGYNCRRVRGRSSMSMHGTGRAIDVFVPRDESQPYNNQADNDLGDEIANYLIENATELGIQYFIWDQASWSIRTGSDRSYGGDHPHHDHLHIELTSAAAGSADGAFPSSFNPHFADDDNSPHEDAINIIYDEGITRGCDDDPEPMYCPEDSESRANVAVMLMRAFDLPRTSEDHFHDDDALNSQDAINALGASGVRTACAVDDEGRFCPGQKVTRGHFALWLDGLLSLEDEGQDYFVDDSGRTYEAAVNRLTAAGIAEGCSTDQFCGGKLITRGEIASFLARAIGGLDRHDAPEPSRPVEIVLQWTSDEVDLDLIMRAPDEITYRFDSPSAQGWLHSSDTCPDRFGAGCTDTLVDGAFSESIWLSTEGVFGDELPEPTLRAGDRGDDVETLQAALTHAGFDAGPVDGIFGGQTAGGLEALQSTDDSVEVTGVYDAPTRELLASRLHPGDDYSVEVKTFGQEASSASFDLLVFQNGEQVESYTGQTAPPLGESRMFEFRLRE